jgi:tetratricopeptide (TPR) repeat protein
LFLILILIFCFCDVFVRADYGLDRFPRHKTIFDCPIRLSPLTKPYAIIPANTIVIEQNRQNVNDIPYVWVSIPSIINFGKPLVGWIKQNDLVTSKELVEKEKARLIAVKETINPDFTIPEILKLNGQNDLKTAYLGICKSIEENEKLNENKRLPEPYFARATVWQKLGNYGEALSDYLTALDYVKNQNDESAYAFYNNYFDNIRETIRNSLTQPKSPIDLGQEKQRRSESHYSRGYSAFWDKNYKLALNHFNNAIQVDWKKPYYWYYRGLTYLRLGDEQKALFNFIFGSNLETLSDYNSRNETSQQLIRFQGNERMFLEEIRTGDPSNILLQKYFNH